MLTALSWILMLLGLLGVVLNIRKRPACFYVWGVTNAGWMLIDIGAGIYAQAALFAAYLGLSIYGAWQWGRGKGGERFGHINL